jgi:hypothetical protein
VPSPRAGAAGFRAVDSSPQEITTMLKLPRFRTAPPRTNSETITRTSTTSRLFRSHRHHRRWPQLEFLEERLAPSGDISAVLSGDVLLLIGDSEANHVTISTNATTGDVEVRGIDTTLNGGTATLSFAGISRIEPQLYGGNDTFEANGLRLPGPSSDQGLFIDGGAGDDRIQIVNTTIEASSHAYIEIHGDSNVGGVLRLLNGVSPWYE